MFNCNGLKDKKAFDAKLEFDLQIIEHHGNDSWVEPTIIQVKKILDSKKIPHSSETCQWCDYIDRVKKND